jgi:hypothetical protein
MTIITPNAHSAAVQFLVSCTWIHFVGMLCMRIPNIYRHVLSELIKWKAKIYHTVRIVLKPIKNIPHGQNSSKTFKNIPHGQNSSKTIKNIPHGQNSSKTIKKIIERSIIDVLITQLHDISHSWLSAGISIKSGGLNPMLNHTVQKSSNATNCW